MPSDGDKEDDDKVDESGDDDEIEDVNEDREEEESCWSVAA